MSDASFESSPEGKGYLEEYENGYLDGESSPEQLGSYLGTDLNLSPSPQKRSKYSTNNTKFK